MHYRLYELFFSAFKLSIKLYRFVIGLMLRAILGREWRNLVYAHYKRIAQLREIFKERLFYDVRPLDGNYLLIRVPEGRILLTRDALWSRDCVYWENVYLRECRVRDNDIIIDVGAHVGLFTLKVARIAKRGLIIALEPHPFTFSLLKLNLKMNNIANVMPLNLALADYNGLGRLYISERLDSCTLSPHKDRKYLGRKGFLHVRVRTLDSLLQELGVRSINFMKIDVEGAELEVLRGASRTLSESEDVCVVVASYHYPKEERDVVRFLGSMGFKCKTYIIRGEVYVCGVKRRH